MRALIVIGLGLAAPAHAEPTSAVVTYESTSTDSHGVTHTIRYQDRIVRDDNNVWIVRVLPRREPRVARAHDLDLAVAARWYTRAGDGVKVVLVSLVNQVIIDVGTESYERLGLVSRWAEVPDPRRLTAGKVKLDHAGRPPWAAVTTAFERVDLSDLGD